MFRSPQIENFTLELSGNTSILSALDQADQLAFQQLIHMRNNATKNATITPAATTSTAIAQPNSDSINNREKAKERGADTNCYLTMVFQVKSVPKGFNEEYACKQRIYDLSYLSSSTKTTFRTF